MASARFAWGIDVGNRALKAVKLVRDGDGFRVDEFEVIEHDTVLSNAGDNRESLVQSALASFVQRHNLKGGTVGVGVSGQSSFARFIKLPPVEPKKIPEIVRFEAIQQIPFPLDDVEWSYQLFQNPESPDVEVGIFAMRKELVNQHIKFFTDFDLNVQVVQMNPLAVYNALQRDGRFDKGTTMVIDLGAENTDLLIADNETIWMRSIPIGGNNFTETLVKAFKLSFSKAEELKRNSATSKYARQIFQAMRPIFADLVAEIQRSIGFYASVHRDSRIKKVIALGGTFRLPGLQKYLQQNLSMDVERLDSIGAGAPSDPKLVPTFNENLLSVVSAYGLALQAMGETKINSSLLPAKIRREKMWKEKAPLFGAAAALIVLGTGLAAGKWLYLDFKRTSAENEFASKIDPIRNQAKSADERWAAIAGAGSEIYGPVTEVAKLQEHRTLWRSIYAELPKAFPVPKEFAGGPSAIKSVKRSERKVVLVESISSRYVGEGFDAMVRDQSFAQTAASGPTGPGVGMTGQGGPGAVAPPPTPAEGEIGNGVLKPDSKGFIITIRCTTPFAAALEPGGLVEKTLIENLMKLKPDSARPRMDFAVARAALSVGSTTAPRQVKADAQRMATIKARFDAVRNAMSTPEKTAAGAPGNLSAAGANANAGATDAESYTDPVLNENVLEDWEFTLVVAVVVNPPPAETAAPAGPQASAQ